MSDIASLGPAMRRSLIPLREKIHSSDVSTILESSLLVRTRSGAKEPVPRITVERVGIKGTKVQAKGGVPQARVSQAGAELKAERDASGECRLPEEFVGPGDVGFDVLVHVGLDHLV